MRAAKKDALHRAVAHVLEQNGFQTIDLSRLGKGIPDILAVRRGICVLIEVKSPKAFRPGSQTQIDQQAFRDRWTECEVPVIETVEEAWRLAELYNGGRQAK